MDYAVKLTPQAVGQLSETVTYISKILLEPQTAKKWADVLQKEIGALCSMPSRYPIVDEEPWRSKGIRKMSVKNFLVYYFIEEESRMVWVIAVIYGRRDQLAALTDCFADRTDQN